MLKRFTVLWLLASMVAISLSVPAWGAEKTIEFWHIETDAQAQVLENAVKRFMEDHPDVEVKTVWTANDPYKTKLRVAMGANTPPDVFHSWGGGWLKSFVDSGKVLNLNDALAEGDWRDRFSPAALSMATYDGESYGVPLAMASVFFWYNKEMFEEHGWTPPETFDELLDLVQKIKAEGIIPISLANKTKWPGAFYLIYLADRIGGPEVFANALNRVEGYGFDHETFVEAGRRIQQLVDAGAFAPGFNGLDYDTGQSRVLVYSGRAAMILQGSWFLGAAYSEAPEFLDKIGMFPFPRVEGGKGDPNNLVGGVSPVWSVSATSKHKEEAIELLHYLTSDETASELADIPGELPAVVGVPLDNELTNVVSEHLSGAKHLQLYYDQALPPELGELHKDTTQALFGKTMTPEEAAAEMEALAKELLD